jgi:hypothetical protein
LTVDVFGAGIETWSLLRVLVDVLSKGHTKVSGIDARVPF